MVFLRVFMCVLLEVNYRFLGILVGDELRVGEEMG